MTYKTGLEDCYVIKNNKKMRLGYTTGSCAAAAASGAAQILLGGKTITEVSLMTPKGILLHLNLEDITVKDNMVSCGVRKDVRTSAGAYTDRRRSGCWQSNQTGTCLQAGRSGHQSGSPFHDHESCRRGSRPVWL